MNLQFSQMLKSHSMIIVAYHLNVATLCIRLYSYHFHQCGTLQREISRCVLRYISKTSDCKQEVVRRKMFFIISVFMTSLSVLEIKEDDDYLTIYNQPTCCTTAVTNGNHFANATLFALL